MRTSGLAVLRKNKHLLDKASQKTFWRSSYASMLCDYAKWEARSGFNVRAIRHLLEALLYAPLNRGRLILSLIYAITFNKPI